MGYSFSDRLTLLFVQDSTVADFEAVSEFTMDFNDGTIGSQQRASGKVDLRSYVPGMQLTYDSFYLTVTDNLGQTTTAEDSVNSTMDEAMSAHLGAIMECFDILQGIANTNYTF